jgi:hypothetical protein
MTTATTNDTSSLILAVIKGEMPLNALTNLGIEVVCEQGFCRLVSNRLPVIATPSVLDVASGLLKYRARRNDLRLWAFFVLAESGGVDLAEVESHPKGDLLIDALWDASNEGKVNESAIEVAENLVRKRC